MASDFPARRRRTHSAEFKTNLVNLCQQPGRSIAAVALAHELNANLLRRWIRQYSEHASMPVVQSSARLVPVQVSVLESPKAGTNIQLDIQHGKTHVSIRWPATDAASCAQWLAAWLK